MKRIIAIVLLAVCCTALFACGVQVPIVEEQVVRDRVCDYAREVITAEIKALIEPTYGVSLQGLRIADCSKQTKKVEYEEDGEKKTREVYDCHSVLALVTYYNSRDNQSYTGTYEVKVFFDYETEDVSLRLLAFGGFGA